MLKSIAILSLSTGKRSAVEPENLNNARNQNKDQTSQGLPSSERKTYGVVVFN